MGCYFLYASPLETLLVFWFIVFKINLYKLKAIEEDTPFDEQLYTSFGDLVKPHSLREYGFWQAKNGRLGIVDTKY